MKKQQEGKNLEIQAKRVLGDTLLEEPSATQDLAFYNKLHSITLPLELYGCQALPLHLIGEALEKLGGKWQEQVDLEALNKELEAFFPVDKENPPEYTISLELLQKMYYAVQVDSALWKKYSYELYPGFLIQAINLSLAKKIKKLEQELAITREPRTEGAKVLDNFGYHVKNLAEAIDLAEPYEEAHSLAYDKNGKDLYKIIDDQFLGEIWLPLDNEGQVEGTFACLFRGVGYHQLTFTKWVQQELDKRLGVINLCLPKVLANGGDLPIYASVANAYYLQHLQEGQQVQCQLLVIPVKVYCATQEQEFLKEGFPSCRQPFVPLGEIKEGASSTDCAIAGRVLSGIMLHNSFTKHPYVVLAVQCGPLLINVVVAAHALDRPLEEVRYFKAIGMACANIRTEVDRYGSPKEQLLEEWLPKEQLGMNFMRDLLLLRPIEGEYFTLRLKEGLGAEVDYLQLQRQEDMTYIGMLGMKDGNIFTSEPMNFEEAFAAVGQFASGQKLELKGQLSQGNTLLS